MRQVVRGFVACAAATPLLVLSAAACSSLETVDLLPLGPGDTASGSGGATAPSTTSSTGSSTTAGSGGSGGSGGSAGTHSGAVGGQSSTTWSNLPKDLVRLYDFSGTGTEVVDRAGGESGVVLGGATLDGSGQLSISDGKSYVRLPSWLLSSTGSSSVTLAAWVTWRGGTAWSRIFDFGSTVEGTDVPGNALSHFYFTPKFEPLLYYSAVLDGNCTVGGQAAVEGTEAFPSGTPTFLAVVVEGDDTLGTSTLRIYVDGVAAGTTSTTLLRLSAFRDPHCWLGQSQWVQDADPFQHYNGLFDEFRIYARALLPAEIAGLSLVDPTKL